MIDGARLTGPNTTFWPLNIAGKTVGKVTSAVYSPRLEKNIALAMVDLGASDLGTEMTVEMRQETRNAVVVEKPFYDPKKAITKA